MSKITMETREEFKVGAHKIGWISSDFLDKFGSDKFGVRSMPTFKKLSRAMNDAAIESELKPGICELGDILAFMDNAPEECKDGYANLFYTSAFVVSVCWFSSYGPWFVYTWRRGGRVWDEGRRVFSPATDRSESGTSISALVPSALQLAIRVVKESGYKIFKGEEIQ